MGDCFPGTFGQDQAQHGFSNEQLPKDPSPNKPQWEFFDDNKWQAMSADISKQIEEAFAAGKPRLTYARNGVEYELTFFVNGVPMTAANKQVNKTTGRKLDVRRVATATNTNASERSNNRYTQGQRFGRYMLLFLHSIT